MDLRSLINKLDGIEQTKLLLESEELMERVGLRLQDIEQAAGRELDDTKRAAIIGDFARKFGYAGLFDPNTGKFVNKDGKFASFGAYQSEVEQLEDEGLIPNSAKTSALLGFLGKDEKESKPKAFARSDLFAAIDKADGLLDKALAESAVLSDNILEGKGIASSLLAEFGLDTTIIEAITPEEHTFLKTTVKDAESIKNKADAIALITRYNKEYIPARDRLIAEIKKIIAAISPATAPAAAPASRSGAAATESLSEGYKPLFELKATKPGITIYQPNFLGYLSPEKAKHNVEMLKAGNAELEPSDHVNQNAQDLANGLTFGFADKAAAYLDSLATGTKYDDQLAKYRSGTNAYNTNKDALNVRQAAGSMGYEIDKDNPMGNITPGDLLSLFGPAGLIKAGVKGAAKLGGGKVAKTVAGLGTGVVAPVAAAMTIGEPEAKAAAKDMSADTLKAMQQELVDAGANLGKFGPNKDGVDGKYGDLTRNAMLDPKYRDIVQKYIKLDSAAPVASEPAPSAPVANAPVANAPAPSAPVANAPALDSFVQDPSITPEVVKTALTKLGVAGNSITPEQLLTLATSLGITSVAESNELDDIRKLSGMNTDLLEVSGFEKVAPWVITNLIAKGEGELARLAGMVVKRGMSAAEIQSIKSAKAVAKKIEAQGAPASPAAGVPGAIPATGLDPIADAAKQMAGKSAEELQAMANNPSLTALQRKAATTELQRIGGSPKVAGAVDNAAGAVDNAAVPGSKVAGAVDNAAGAVDNAASTASKSVLYKTTYALGKLGGKFTQLVKNNKFLSLLAALATLGIAVYLLGSSNSNDPNSPNSPNSPVQPQPGPDPKEEERKRQLAELEQLLAKLNDGWPTDPETAETIQAAVAVGAKAPANAQSNTSGSSNAVQPQPAATTPRIDPRSGLDMNRFN